MAMIDPMPRICRKDEPLLEWVGPLVERHTRYATDSLSEAQHHLHSLNDCIALSVDRPEGFIRYREVLLPMGDLVLTIGCIEARQGYELQFQTGDEYLITIPMRGSGWASTGDMFVEYGKDDIMIVAPSCSVVKHWDGPGEVLSVHFPADLFDAIVTKLQIATRPVGPITTVGTRRLRSFLRVVDMLCRDLQDDTGLSPFQRQPMAGQVEELLLTLLLEHLAVGDQAASLTAQASPAVPYYVRRAEGFITGNAHCDIGIDDVAAAAGVSLRTIQYGFRKYRNTTPMLFLKRIRYERARSMLRSSQGTRRKISDIAAEIGFANVSQFSREYRTLFGETPSQTVTAPRRFVA